MFKIKIGKKIFKFDDINDAQDFCFENGIDPSFIKVRIRGKK